MCAASVVGLKTSKPETIRMAPTISQIHPYVLRLSPKRARCRLSAIVPLYRKAHTASRTRMIPATISTIPENVNHPERFTSCLPFTETFLGTSSADAGWPQGDPLSLVAAGFLFPARRNLLRPLRYHRAPLGRRAPPAGGWDARPWGQMSRSVPALAGLGSSRARAERAASAASWTPAAHPVA